MSVVNARLRTIMRTLLCTAGLAAVMASASLADEIYLYNGSGALVDCTAAVVFTNPYVFDSAGLIGTVGSDGLIRDANNVVIGLVDFGA